MSSDHRMTPQFLANEADELRAEQRRKRWLSFITGFALGAAWATTVIVIIVKGMS